MTTETQVIALEQVASRANIKQIYYDGGKVKIDYTINPSYGNKTNCGERPSPDFEFAFNKLKHHAMKTVDLDKNDWSKTVRLLSIKISFKKDQRCVQFKVYKEISSTGLFIEFTTPTMLVTHPKENVIQLGKEAEKDIDAMIYQAQLYIAGDRYQTRLLGTGE